MITSIQSKILKLAPATLKTEKKKMQADKIHVIRYRHEIRAISLPQIANTL